MRYVQGKIRTLLAQQSGQIQLLIIAPILTLAFLSLVVRTASSAIDPSLEKKKVTQQLKQRLTEVRNLEGNQLAIEARSRENAPIMMKAQNLEGSSLATAEKAEHPLGVRPQEESQATEKVQNDGKLWQVVREKTRQELTLALFDTSVSSNGEEARMTAPARQTGGTWKIMRGNPRQETSLAPMAIAALSPVFTRIEGTSPEVKIHDTEEVRKTIENQARRKTSPVPVVTASLAPLPFSAIQPSTEEVPLVPLPQKIVHQIKKNETPEKIFKRIGISSAEAAQWIKVTRKLNEFRSLRPGQVLEFSFADELEQHALKTLSYEMGEGSRLILERKARGVIETKREIPPTLQVWVVIGGRIERSLYKSARKLGLPGRIIDGLAALDWDFNLSELHTGDSFKVLVEALQRNEKIVEYKGLLAAEVSKKGQVYNAFFIPEERLLSRKNTEEGSLEEGLDIESEGQRFLRYPLDFTHISSGFSEARLHPILGYARPHTGVDFAAPPGTLVHAVASGTVIFVGRQSGYGNIVRIDHPGPYDTAYAHLQGFAEGVEEGVAVEEGQVIGYVGSTGLATGPHLHFELLKDGDFVNPLTEKSSSGEPVKVVKEQPKPVIDPVIVEKKKRLADQLAALEIGKNSVISVIIPLQNAVAASGVASGHEAEQHEAAAQHASSAKTRNR